MAETIAPLLHSSTSSNLPRRQLGNTDLQISIMGFGASPLGDVFGIANPAEGIRAVHHAVSEGINFFDVSPYYGLTLAEQRLGEGLKGRRQQVVLSTKCGRYGADEFDFSARRIRQSLEESLKRLQTDYVDLLHAHDIEFGDLPQIIEETIPTMRRLQEEGKVRYIGISGYPIHFLMRVAKAAPIDTILGYCHYNLLANDLTEELSPFAESSHIGLINASPLHMGLLTEQGPPSWRPAPTEVQRAASQAIEYCHTQGADLSEIALHYCLQYPHVATTLVGMSTSREVQRNPSALDASVRPETLKRIQEILAPVHNTIWVSGKPENN